MASLPKALMRDQTSVPSTWDIAKLGIDECFGSNRERNRDQDNKTYREKNNL